VAQLLSVYPDKSMNQTHNKTLVLCRVWQRKDDNGRTPWILRGTWTCYCSYSG